MCASRTRFAFQRRVSGSREMRRWQKVWMFNTEISLKNKKCEPAAVVHFRMKTRLGPVCCGAEGVLMCHPPPLPRSASRSYSFTTYTCCVTGWVRPRLPPMWPCRYRTDLKINLKNKKCGPAADVHSRMKTRLGPRCVGRGCYVTALPPCGRADVGLPSAPRSARPDTHVPNGPSYINSGVHSLGQVRKKIIIKVRDQLGQTRMFQTVLFILTRGFTTWARFARQ